MTITAKYTGRMGDHVCFEVDGFEMYIFDPSFGEMVEGRSYTIKIK